MKQIFVFFLFFISLGAHDFLSHSVDVTTGNFIDCQEDLHLGGPHPIKVTRFYHTNEGHTFTPDFFDPKAELPPSFSKETRKDHEKLFTKEQNSVFRSITIFKKETIFTIVADDQRVLQYEFFEEPQGEKKKRRLLKKATLPNGESIAFEYIEHPKSKKRLLSGIRSSGESSLNIHYDDKGRVKSLYFPEKESSVTFIYNKKNTVVIDGLGQETVYWLNEANKVCCIETKGLRKEELAYDKEGRIKQKKLFDAEGELLYEKNLSWDQKGRLTFDEERAHFTGRSARLEKRSKTFLYEENPPYRLLKETTSEGDKTLYLYEKDSLHFKGIINYKQDKIVSRTLFNYENGLPTTILEDNGTSSDPSDNQGQTFCIKTSLSYIEEGIFKGYLASSLKEKKKEGETSFTPLMSKYLTYDERGNICKEESIDHTLNQTLLISFSYDQQGRVTAKEDSLGSFTRYEYDDKNRLFSLQENQNVCFFTYDQKGRLLKETIVLENGFQKERRFQYNERSLLEKIEYGVGVAKFFKYDSFGRMIEEIFPTHLGEGGKEETLILYYEYDCLMRKTSIKDHLGNKTRFTYNFLGKPTSIRYPDESFSLSHYTLFGELQFEQKRDKQAKRSLFDPQKRVWVSEYIDASGSIYNRKEYTLEVEEKRSEPSQKMGHQDKTVFSKVINSLGQEVVLKKSVNPYGGDVLEQLNANGLVEERTLFSKEKKILSKSSYRYDAHLNCVFEEHEVDPHHSYTIRREFDAERRVLSIEEAGSLYKYDYDSLGNLCRIEKPDGVVIQRIFNERGQIQAVCSSDQTIDYLYEYDEMGNCTLAIDKKQNKIVSRTFDKAGNLLEDTIDKQSVFFTYDLLGRKTSIRYPDDSISLFTYDGNSLFLQRGDSTISFTLSESGCRRSSLALFEEIRENQGDLFLENPFFSCKRETLPGGLLIKEGGSTKEASLDEAGRLHTFCFEKRTYDTFSNTIDSSLQYDHRGALCSKDGVEILYDKNGSTISYGEKTFRYDAFDRLIEAQTVNGLTRFIYDPFGRLIEKEENGITSFILYDGNFEIGCCREDGSISCLKILNPLFQKEPFNTLALEIEKSLYFPLHDTKGSIIALADSVENKLSALYEYTPFGKSSVVLGGSLAEKNIYRFLGKREEKSLSLIHLNQRFYDPSLERFLTKDPKGLINGPNRYLYCNQNPLSFCDPKGLSKESNNFFDYFYRSIDTLFMHYNNAVKFLEYFNKKNSFFYYTNDQIEYFGEQFFGKNFLVLSGYTLESRILGCYGQEEKSDSVRLTMINGILVTKNDCTYSVDFLSQTHGNTNVHFIYRPTYGWTWDLFMCSLVKIGYVSDEAKELAALWKHLIDEMGGVDSGGIICHYAHSLGGAETYAAKSLLSEEEQKMIKVITFGSAKLIPNQGFLDVQNFVSFRDGVPILDPLNYVRGMLSHENNIHFIGSYVGIPFIDHLISGETYHELIERLGQAFIEEYLR